MKKKILKIANACLAVFNARIISSNSSSFDMDSAIRRITGHGIDIQSVFDIGASDGKWSRNVMPIFPNAKFIGVEPLAERESALEALRDRSGNFDYILCVAGDSDGLEVRLGVTDDLDGSTVDGGDGDTRMVPVRTLDAIVSEHGLTGPFLLKFDTHGYELPILQGATKTLSETNVIVMEVYNFKITEHALRFHEMCAHLENLGFRSFDMAEPTLRDYDSALWQMDLFFTREDEQMFAHNSYR